MRTLQNLRITVRLTIAFVIVVMLAVIAVATALVNARENADAVNRMMALPLAKERITSDWYAHVYSAVGRTSLIAKSTDATLTAAFADEIAHDAKQGTELGRRIKDLLSSSDEQTIYAAAMELRGRYLDAKGKIMAARQAGDTNTADAIFHKQFKTASQLYLKKVLELKQLERDAIDEMTKSINTATTRSFRLVLLLICLLVALAGVAAMVISRSITGPLTRAVAVARTVASGDLTTIFKSASSDEIGDLMRSLQAMNVALAEVIGKVQAGTNTIAVASGQIAMGNLDLSARTESQAGTLEETAASMEELTATVRQNAENAREANRLASEASEVATKGGAMVDQVVDAMDNIGSASKKIVNIIGVIDGIAFQTNILALNAAVEAARAGEHGRGFAVVASEVRNLAQRAAAAAKEIKQLIGQSSEQVNHGELLVEQAGESMKAVVVSIGKVTSIMSEITTASHEQSAGIEQVNQAVSSMDQVTQQNAALVEEAAAAATSLREQADGLATLAAGFLLFSDASTFRGKKTATHHAPEHPHGVGRRLPVLS